MHIRLFDGPDRDLLLPFVYLRPVADLFMGMMTFKERWSLLTGAHMSVETVPYLQSEDEKDADFSVLASCLPDSVFVDAVLSLKPNEKLMHQGQMLAFHGSFHSQDLALKNYNPVVLSGSDFKLIKHSWDLFTHNGFAIHQDYESLTRGAITAFASETNTLLGEQNLFIGEDVDMEGIFLNTTSGPIYIDDGATIMEGSMLRGPLYVGKNTVVKMGSKIYGNTSLGPEVRVGGELSNVIFFGFSNKGHDGFLGNAVIGKWCNIGAATDASNLKNDYGDVKAWSYAKKGFVDTGLQFCGLLMGDHSQCAIHTTFNTATTIGIGCNIFGNGFPRTFIPSFSRGGAQGFVENKLDKVLKTVQLMMSRRNMNLEAAYQNQIQEVFHQTTFLRK